MTTYVLSGIDEIVGNTTSVVIDATDVMPNIKTTGLITI